MDIFMEQIDDEDKMVTVVTCEYCEQYNNIVIVGFGNVLLWGVALLYTCFMFGGQLSAR